MDDDMCSPLGKEKQKFLSSDKSRKGSVDKNIVDLIDYINDRTEYCTTSSCSGRIVVYQQPENSDGQVKKGCHWLFVSHNQVNINDVLESLKDHKDSAVFKFEPFILHVRCISLEAAKKLLTVSIASGFRNSGITLGNSGKIMLAVRSTHGLEVPVSCNGNMLVSDQYLSYIVEKGNDKLLENEKKIERFFSGLKAAVNNVKVTEEEASSKQFDKIKIIPRSEKRLPEAFDEEYKLDGLSELLT
ncbi:tRNA wybutosine-synthesizing protein 3 homolog [Centruroides vittatus]|uniref:tRNA wybutosine-synthesizing protein 3 homolog n=1 Tax=Centruroides vittatus TaxID=120091 RepID=UPI00350F0A04